MSEDVEKELLQKPKTRNFSVQKDFFFLKHHLLFTICPVKGHSVKYVLNSKIYVFNSKIYVLNSKIDESTLTDNEAVLIVYVRYVDEDNFAEEMLFC